LLRGVYTEIASPAVPARNDIEVLAMTDLLERTNLLQKYR